MINCIGRYFVHTHERVHARGNISLPIYLSYRKVTAEPRNGYQRKIMNYTLSGSFLSLGCNIFIFHETYQAVPPCFQILIHRAYDDSERLTPREDSPSAATNNVYTFSQFLRRSSTLAVTSPTINSGRKRRCAWTKKIAENTGDGYR